MSGLSLTIALLAGAIGCQFSAEAFGIQSRLRYQEVQDTRNVIPWKYPPPVFFVQNQRLHIVLEGNNHITSAVFYMAVNPLSKSSQPRYRISLHCRVTDSNVKVCQGTAGPKLNPDEVVHYSIKVVLMAARVMWLTNQRWVVEHPLTTVQ